MPDDYYIEEYYDEKRGNFIPKRDTRENDLLR